MVNVDEPGTATWWNYFQLKQEHQRKLSVLDETLLNSAFLRSSRAIQNGFKAIFEISNYASEKRRKRLSTFIGCRLAQGRLKFIVDIRFTRKGGKEGMVRYLFAILAMLQRNRYYNIIRNVLILSYNYCIWILKTCAASSVAVWKHQNNVSGLNRIFIPKGWGKGNVRLRLEGRWLRLNR